MADPISVSGALTAARVAMEMGRGIVRASTALQEAELKMKILELVDALGQMNVAMLELQASGRDKDALIADLKMARVTREQVVYERGAYWQPSEGAKDDGPFCTRCMDVDGILVRISVGMPGHYLCPNCKGVMEY